MITKSMQDWSIGKTVRVGFLRLTVLAMRETPGDHKPDCYLLGNGKGILYEFTPHYGLESISREDAQSSYKEIFIVSKGMRDLAVDRMFAVSRPCWDHLADSPFVESATFG